MKVHLDTDQCVRPGMCALLSPDASRLDDQARRNVPEGALAQFEGDILAAVAACPVHAFSVMAPVVDLSPR